MHVELIAATADRKAYLTSMLDPVQDIDITAQVRDVSPDWHRRLRVESTDILIVDSPANGQHQHLDRDLVLLNQWVGRHPALGVLLLTDDIDPAFLLQAMRSGVREVLRLHPARDEFQQAMNRLQRHVQSFNPMAHSDAGASPARGRLLAFVPSKGGCGSTFMATNTAYLLAKEYERDTLLIDLDLHGADASYYLSSDDHRNSLLDLTRHIDRLDAHLLHSSLHPVIPQLFLLAAPEISDLATPITPGQLEQVLQLARQQYGMVLLDLPDALDALTVKALDMADEVYLLLHNTVPNVRNAKRWITMLRSLGYADTKLRVVLNKTHSSSDIDASHIESALGLPLCQTLPGDPATVLQAINQGVPLMTLNANSPLVQALRQFIEQEWHLTASRRKSWLERWF
jgi:pilus assembly protein CpaE